jgi:hypothetical protein
MDSKKKRNLIIIGIIEVIIMAFCLTISILVVVKPMDKNGIASNNIKNNGAFIGGLQNNPVLFFCSIVLPLFIILIADGVYLIMYAMKKESNISDSEKAAIQEEAAKQAREEIMKELNQKKDEDKKE